MDDMYNEYKKFQQDLAYMHSGEQNKKTQKNKEMKR